VRGIWLAALVGAVACGGESKRVVSDAGDSNGGVGGGGTGGAQQSARGGDEGTAVGAGGYAAALGSGGSGTGGSSGGSGGCADGLPSSGECCSNAGPTDNVVLTPGPTGWIDYQDVCNVLGIQGAWHVYGDQYDSPETQARCIEVGLHMPSECAQVTTPPPPPALGFANIGGAFHIAGSVEAILACPAGMTTIGCPAEDFENMNGAGIGFDFHADASPPDSDGVRRAWDPSAYDVIGVSFFIDKPPKDMHVEFPILLTDAEAAADDPPVTGDSPTSENQSYGSPYWGAQARGDGRFPPSPVVAGENVVFWEDVAPPHRQAYTFEPRRMIGVRFHVVAGVAGSFDFTIRNFTFLRHR
jgi:hypothetical protein